MDNGPKISVLMSAYNTEKYVKTAIQSVLEQTLGDFEFIIINDASTDKTWQIIKSFNDPRIKLINNDKNLGLTKNLNRGLKLARGKYIARLDADDAALPTRLEKQYQFMENHPEIVLAGAGVKQIDENGQLISTKLPPCYPIQIKFAILFRNPIFHSTIFFRREAILKINGYNESYRYAQDYELYSRLVKKYKLANLDELLVKFRVHQKSVTAMGDSQKIMLQNALKTIYQNINNYLKLSEREFSTLKKALIIKGIKEKISWRDYMLARRIIKRIFSNFIAQEKLTNKEIKKIQPLYNELQKTIRRRWLVSLKKKYVK